MLRKIIIAMTMMVITSGSLGAEDMLEKKSFRALKMEGMMNEDQLDSFEIQIEIGKIYFKENLEKNPPPQPSSEDKKRGYILLTVQAPIEAEVGVKE